MQPFPIIRMQVIPTKYTRLIKVVAFFDTGASFTIMNLDILPLQYQKKKKKKKKKRFFHATNGNIFATELISVDVGKSTSVKTMECL